MQQIKMKNNISKKTVEDNVYKRKPMKWWIKVCSKKKEVSVLKLRI